MFFKKRNSIIIGRVVKELRLCRSFGLRWRWRRVFFRQMRIEAGAELNSHIMITGESGSGKSNVCKQLLNQLALSGAKFMVLDPHSEYVEYAESLGANVYDAGMSGVAPARCSMPLKVFWQQPQRTTPACNLSWSLTTRNVVRQ